MREIASNSKIREVWCFVGRSHKIIESCYDQAVSDSRCGYAIEKTLLSGSSQLPGVQIEKDPKGVEEKDGGIDVAQLHKKIIIETWFSQKLPRMEEK